MFVDIHNKLRKKCMSNMKKRYTAAAAMMMVLGMCASASAAFDENLNDYTLDAMVVEADAVKNKFTILLLGSPTIVPAVTLRLLLVRRLKNVIILI